MLQIKTYRVKQSIASWEKKEQTRWLTKVNHIVQLAPVIAHLQAIAVKINVRRRYGKMHPSKQLLPYTTLGNVNYNRDCNIYAVHVLTKVPKINVSPEKCLAEPFYTGLQRYVKVTCLFPDESLYNVKNNQKRCSLRAPLQPRSYGCGSLNSKKKNSASLGIAQKRIQ